MQTLSAKWRIGCSASGNFGSPRKRHGNGPGAAAAIIGYGTYHRRDAAVPARMLPGASHPM